MIKVRCNTNCSQTFHQYWKEGCQDSSWGKSARHGSLMTWVQIHVKKLTVLVHVWNFSTPMEIWGISRRMTPTLTDQRVWSVRHGQNNRPSALILTVERENWAQMLFSGMYVACMWPHSDTHQTQVHAVIINNEIRFKLLKKKHNANFKTSKIDLLLSANSSQLALTYITNMLWVYICGYDA